MMSPRVPLFVILILFFHALGQQYVWSTPITYSTPQNSFASNSATKDGLGNTYHLLLHSDNVQVGNQTFRVGPGASQRILYSSNRSGGMRWSTSWTVSDPMSRSFASNIVHDITSNTLHVIDRVDTTFFWRRIDAMTGSILSTVTNNSPFSPSTSCFMSMNRIVLQNTNSLFVTGVAPKSGCGTDFNVFGINITCPDGCIFVAKLDTINSNATLVKTIKASFPSTVPLAEIQDINFLPNGIFVSGNAPENYLFDDSVTITRNNFILYVSSTDGSLVKYVSFTGFPLKHVITDQNTNHVYITGVFGANNYLTIDSKTYDEITSPKSGFYVIQLKSDLSVSSVVSSSSSNTASPLKLAIDGKGALYLATLHSNTFFVGNLLLSRKSGINLSILKMFNGTVEIFKSNVISTNLDWNLASKFTLNSLISLPESQFTNFVLQGDFSVDLGAESFKMESLPLNLFQTFHLGLSDGCFDVAYNSEFVCQGQGTCVSTNNCTCNKGWKNDCKQPDYSFVRSGSRPVPPECNFVNPFGECLLLNQAIPTGCKYMTPESKCAPYSDTDLEEYRNGVFVDGNFAVSWGQNSKYKTLTSWPISFTFYTKGKDGFSTVCFSKDGLDYNVGFCFVATSKNGIVSVSRYSDLSRMTLSNNTDQVLLPNYSQDETSLTGNHTTIGKMNGIYGMRFVNDRMALTLFNGDAFPHYSKFQILLNNKFANMFASRPFVSMGYAMYESPVIPLVYTDRVFFRLNLTDYYPLSVSPASWSFVMHRFETMDVILWCLYNIAYLALLVITLLFFKQKPLSTRGAYPFLAIILHWLNHFSCIVLFFPFLGTVHAMPYFAPIKFASLFTLVFNSQIEVYRYFILESIQKIKNSKQESERTKLNRTKILVHPAFEIALCCVVFVAFYFVILAIGFIPTVLPLDMDFILLWIIIGCFSLKLVINIIFLGADLSTDTLKENRCDPVSLVYSKDTFWFRFQFYILDSVVFLCILSGLGIVTFIMFPALYSFAMYALLFRDVIFILIATIADAIEHAVRNKKPKPDVLMEFMSNRNNHDKFLEFAISEWSSENIYFVDAVSEFSKMNGDDKKALHDASQKIIELYLQAGSLLQVWVSPANLAEMKGRMEKRGPEDEIPRDIFQKLVWDCLNTLADTYSRFIHSTQHRELNEIKNIEKTMVNPNKEMNTMVSGDNQSLDLTHLMDKIALLEQQVSKSGEARSTDEMDKLRHEMKIIFEKMEEMNKQHQDRIQESMISRVEGLVEHVTNETDKKFDNLIRNIQNGRCQHEE